MADTARRRGILRAVSLVTSPEMGLALAGLAANIALIIAYLAATGTVVRSLSDTLYPVVWIVLGVYLVASLVRRGPRVISSPLAVTAALGYGLLLAAIGTPVGLGSEANTVAVTWATPGWGPIIMYSVGPVGGTLLPFEVVGYAALAYAVGSAVAAGSRGVLAGTVGLFTCVGCVLPVVGALVGLFGGTATALQPAATSYGLATGLFAVTVVLLLATIPLE
ncbi:MAG: hypothetical protein ACI8TL_000406 [Natronomonas sp.]|jgi:hypothetical protein